MAMLPYAILLKPSAIEDMDRMRKYDAVRVAEGIGHFLSHAPMRESRSRIKRLMGISNPDYRLRLDAYRVFYTVYETKRRVDVLRILHKDETPQYYKELKP